MEKDIRIETIGNIEVLPVATLNVLKKAIETTKNNKSMTLVFALNYGGRDDIVQAVNKALKTKDVKELTEKDISDNISTSQYPDVDLMIRTSLDYRLSNFLLWQLSYSELYFVDCYWPDFDEKQFEKAIKDYSERQRRFGGLK